MALVRRRPKPTSEQDVRDASVASLRMSRRGLVITTAVTLVFSYLGLAAATHLWPWRVNQQFENATKVTSYYGTSYPSPQGSDTATLSITVVNNAPSPVRGPLLKIPAGGTGSRSAIRSDSAVGLTDIQPCQALKYVATFEMTDPDPIISDDHPDWKLIFTIDNLSWSEPLGSSDEPSALATVDKDKGLRTIYGIGGLSRTTGWLGEKVDTSPSHGPGCG
ncbi:hypothetical protein [Actinophytocola sp.]|uniref:hypothetical protein n=1 Tax=Actinophytocola sp. TaxID=1872138 RepID=UPI00389A26A7